LKKLNVLIGVVFAGSAFGSNLFITPTFDASISGSANALAIEAAINSAIATLNADFTNPITVPIYFQAANTGLGGSNFPIFTTTYAAFHTDLIANNANPAALAALAANGGNGTNNPVTGTANIALKGPDARALGFAAGPACQLTAGSGVPEQCGGSTGTAYDGVITLNTSITTPGNPGSTLQFNLTAVALHEIDEILGLGSDLANTNATSGVYNTLDIANTPSPEDLFRWNAASGGTRTLSTNCTSGLATNAFFSYGPSTGNIAQFNNLCNGADFGDWAASASPRVQDAFAIAGASPTLGVAEIDALTAIGFIQSSATPEPAAFLPLAAGLGYLGLRLRRRK
jgi:hypothetical protein